jgi:hypothetical protein
MTSAVRVQPGHPCRATDGSGADGAAVTTVRVGAVRVGDPVPVER